MTGVVLTALRVEQFALRAGMPAAAVRRCGMGTVRAAARAARVTDADALLVAGLGGGVGAGVRPGDVVVASELRGAGGSIACAASPLLAGALRRDGLHVHLGPIATSSGIVTGDARRGYAAEGVLAVDMESAAVALSASGFGSAGSMEPMEPQSPRPARRTSPDVPVAAVRVIVDTADEPLLRADLPLRGIRALRTLRSAASTFADWSAAARPRDVVLAQPRSFCAGVERAVETVESALVTHGAPVYVRREIVHNAHVVADLERRGAVFVKELDDVPEGELVVLAAHGVAPSVHAQAQSRGLRVIDATCPLVSKVHAEVRRHAARGDTVLLIGHRDHEEVVGTVGEAPGNVLVIETPDEAETVAPAHPDRVAYAMQTTLAVDEAEDIAGVLRRRFPRLREPRSDDICYATTNRQQAVRQVAGEVDLMLVVGSPNSSNSLRLVEVAQRAGAPAHLVEDATEVDLRWLAGAGRVGITAGASAPPYLVDELVGCLAGLGRVTVHEDFVVEEDVVFALPKEVSSP